MTLKILWLLALLLASTKLYIADAVDYKLDGNSYIIYSPAAKFLKTELTVHLLFRTTQPSGVLLHARGTNGDFITLEIVRGKLRCASVFSRSGKGPATNDVTVGDDLGDDQWHQIDIERNNGRLLIIFDVTRKRLTADLMRNYQNISVAGLPRVNPKNTSIPRTNSLPPVSLTGTAFKGCMEDVTVNKFNIFDATKEKSKDIHVLGKLWPKCADDAKDYPPATLRKSTSYIKIETVNGDDANLNFKFRTFDHTGVLVHYSLDSSTKQTLFLELINGKLIVRYAFQDVNTNNIISPKYTTYADGLWHSIRLNLTSKGVAIQVNNETTQKLQDHMEFRNLFQNTTLTIGTGLPNKPSVKGCVREIQVNGKNIKVTSSNDVTLNQCYLSDLCFINPCLNQGVCQQHNGSIQCDCTQTAYSGSRCQNISIAPHHKILSTQNTSVKAKGLPAGTGRPHVAIKPSTKTTSKVFKTSPTSFEQSLTAHRNPTAKSNMGLKTKKILTVKPSERTQTISTAQPSQSTISTTRGQISTVKQSERIQTTSAGQLNQSTTSTRGQIFTGKPKRVISTTNKRISTVKPNQSTTPQSSSSPTKQIIITQLNQATTSAKIKLEKTSTVQPKQSITPFKTQTIPFSTTLQDQLNPVLNLHTSHSVSSTDRPTPRRIPPTTINPTDKVNTRIIITVNSDTKADFNQNQLLVYLFLFIVFFLFVGLIVIISIRLSNFNACPCIRRFQTVNGSLPSQDSIELGHHQRKDKNEVVRVKSDRPSSVNDSGIHHSESGTGSNRSSMEVQDDDKSNNDDLGTRLGDRGELGTIPDDPTEGFLIFQEDPSLYTQKSFGWTILSSSNTLRRCRTSTRDLKQAGIENKPRAFISEYYAADSELCDEVRLGTGDDVSGEVMYTRYRNPTTKYRQLTASDCSSVDNVPIGTEESPGLERNAEEVCSVF